MELSEFKQKYPDIYAAIEADGKTAGHQAGKAEGYAEGLVAGQTAAAAAIKQGRDEGIAAGAAAERERIAAIDTLAIPGHEGLIVAMKADGTSAADAAVKLIQAEKLIRVNVAQALAADGILPVAHVQASGMETQPVPDGPEKWKADYAASEQLQKEFKTEAVYLSYQQGVKNGRIKILGRKAE